MRSIDRIPAQCTLQRVLYPVTGVESGENIFDAGRIVVLVHVRALFLFLDQTRTISPGIPFLIPVLPQRPGIA